MTEVIQETIGQFTGLYDKNGVKIFEGDKILIAKEEDDEVFFVQWDDDTARFTLSAKTYTVDFDNYSGSDCEVIGNIHQEKENNNEN